MNATIHRYLIREMIPPFSITLIFFLFIFLMTKLLEVTNFVVNYDVDVWIIGLMLLYSVPFFLQFVIPMAVMMGVLLAFLRLSSDNETVAMKACGISVYKVLSPALGFSLLGTLVTAWVTVYAMPWGSSAIKQMAIKLAASSLEIGLKERSFNDQFEDVVVYVSKVDPHSGALQHLFIEDRRNPKVISTIIAPEGRLHKSATALSAHLQLTDGSITQVDLATRSANAVHFDRYDLRLNLQLDSVAEKENGKHRSEMSLTEMRDYLNTYEKRDSRYYRTLMDYHKKFSIPLAGLVLGLLAVPLGFQSGGARRSYGVGLGLMLFLLYYVVLTAGWTYGKTGAVPPMIGMWAPNVLFALLGAFFLRRCANDRGFGLDQLYVWASHLWRRRVRRIRGGRPRP
ncbi:MAG: LPS export ABC transporter permease LptF [Desulfosarcinaceae bacterium]|nr:LPS export ABC transporter permease LptF [Desulfosarcinaceae bacterium]